MNINLVELWSQMGWPVRSVILVLTLAGVGPAAWREGIETAAPLGVAVAAAATFGVVSIIILTRGARLRPTDGSSQEAVAVAEVPP